MKVKMSYQRIDWTPDMDAAINVEGRANLAQLARELQVSANAIRLRALKLNAPERPEAWQNWQLDILKAEWPKGTLSSSQIGNLIGKTRNAVIGKAHRLKLGNRTPSGDRRYGSDRKERPPRVKATIPRAPKTNMAIIKKGVIPPRFYPEAVPLTTKPPISIIIPVMRPLDMGLMGLWFIAAILPLQTSRTARGTAPCTMLRRASGGSGELAAKQRYHCLRMGSRSK